MAEGDAISNVVMSVMAAIIGIALVCTGLIPLAIDYIGGLTDDAAQWAPLLYLVVVVVILGLIIGVMRYFTTSGRSER